MIKLAGIKGTVRDECVASLQLARGQFAHCRLAHFMIIALLLTCVGCRGSASYTIVSLDMRRVSPNEQFTLGVDAGECYHWVNDFGELCVAMRMNDRSLLGKRFSRSSTASFVLGEPPIAAGKNYKATRRTARFVNDAGYGHTRAASVTGIVGVWNYDKPVIAGRFRVKTVQQSYSVLTGWKGKKQVLYVGEFGSVLNRAAGEAILAETEQNGMERKRPIGKPRRIQGPFPTKSRKNKS